jgi:hypothetical protein
MTTRIPQSLPVESSITVVLDFPAMLAPMRTGKTGR